MNKTFRYIIVLAAIIIGSTSTSARLRGGSGIIVTDVTGGTVAITYKQSNAEPVAVTPGTTEVPAGATVTVGLTADVIHTFNGATVTAVTANSTDEAEARSLTRSDSDGPGIGGTEINVSDIDQSGNCTFTMPTGSDVALTVRFADKPSEDVAYINADGILCDGQGTHPAKAKAYVLDGTETTLGEPGGTSSSPKETWYVCNTNLSYTTFNFSSNCNVNIILADNVEMSVINSNGDAISNSYDSQDSFGVYGQSKGSDRGTLTAKSTSSGGYAINIKGGVIISHCKLTAEGVSYGIRACGSDKDVTISGAEVKATATSGSAICSDGGGVSISGGTVTAKGSSNGIYSYGGGVSISGGTVTAEGDDYGIRAYGSGKNVIISGDAEVTAKAPGTYGYAICSDGGGVSIIGGTVTAVGDNYGIRAGGSGKDVTISGAKVTATATDDYAIYSYNGNVSITGGTVTAGGTKGIFSSGDIILGWTSATDFICANRYYVGDGKAVKIAAGKRFVAYNMASESDISANCIIGDATSTDATAIATDISLADATAAKTIAGKTLKPLDGYTVTVADDISLMDGTTAKTPDFTIGTTPYYIYKASTEQNPVTVTLSYGGTDFVTVGGLPEGTTLNAVANQPMQRSFAMPAENLALTATAVTGLTASGDTYTYDGTAKTPTVKLGDDVFATTNYVVAYKKGGSAVSEAKKAGTYSCTVNGSGSYIGTIATDVAITINPKTVTVTGGITASNKTYDGKTTATLSGKNAVISGKVDGDNLGVSASGAFANKNAGNNKTVNINSITLTGSDKDNYVLATTTGSNQATTTANISKKALTVTADDKSVSYGDAAPTYTASYSGFVSGESKSNSDLSGSLRFSCSYTSSSNTGSYTIKPSGLSSSNYDISYTNGTLTVGAKNVTYSGGTVTQDQNGYTVSLDEGTGSANPLPDDADLYKLTYSRTLTAPGSGEGDVKIGGQAAKLYTVCLPFTPETGTDVKYYTLSSVSVSGETVSFEEVTSPAANTPYLVAVTGSTNITESCTNEVVTSTDINTTTKNGYTFTGTFTGLTNSQAVGKHILQSKNKWCVVENGSVFIPPFRAYIESASGARELTGSFEGEDDATGIVNIRTTDADGTERWYDLNGRRIDQPTKKGIYIRNGKKEIRK